MTSPCDADLTGLPEWVRAEYYQEHKEHGCLWADSPIVRKIEPKKTLGTIMTVRFTGPQAAELRRRADAAGVTTSWLIRDMLFPGHGHVCDPENPDCAAYIFYDDPKNREPVGPGVRRNAERAQPED